MNLWQIFSYIGAAVILIHGLFFAVNNMSRCTRHDMRAAWVMLLCGALAVFIWPEISSTLLILGTALFVYADRRCRYDCPEIRKK